MNPSVNVNWVPGITLEEMEKHCIMAAYRFYRSNKTQTASSLGIAIRTLDNKLEKYEADSKRDKDRDEAERLERAATLERMRGPLLTKQFAVGSSSQWAEQPKDTTPASDIGAHRSPAKSDGKANEDIGKNGNQAASGVRVEPTSEAGTQSPMPVPERKEVQSVLPRQTGSHSKRGRSQGV